MLENINVKDLKEIDKELLKKIIKEVETGKDLEDYEIETDDKLFIFRCVDRGEWKDDGCGKYFSQEKIYVLELVDEDFKTIEKYNVILTQFSSKTGSYYTDWHYEYEDMSIMHLCEKVIPEQIIPEHTIVALDKYIL